MSKVAECCGKSFAIEALIGHVEEAHIRPVSWHEIQIFCAECDFSVTRAQLNSMLVHSLSTKHQLDRMGFDWRNFAELEEQRTLKLLRTAYNALHGTSTIDIKSEPDFLTPVIGGADFSSSTIISQDSENEAMLSYVKSLEESDIPKKKQKRERISKPSYLTKWKCNSCEWNSKCLKANKLRAISHVISEHKPNNLEQFQCPLCSHSADKINETWYHIFKAHPVEYKNGALIQITEEQKSKFTQCLRKSFPGVDWSEIPYLDAQPAENNRRKLVCNICDMALKGSNTTMFRHVLSVHTEIKAFSCKLCTYSTSWRSSMANHLRGVHISNNLDYKVGLSDAERVQLQMAFNQGFPGKKVEFDFFLR